MFPWNLLYLCCFLADSRVLLSRSVLNKALSCKLGLWKDTETQLGLSVLRFSRFLGVALLVMCEEAMGELGF